MKIETAIFPAGTDSTFIRAVSNDNTDSVIRVSSFKGGVLHAWGHTVCFQWNEVGA